MKAKVYDYVEYGETDVIGYSGIRDRVHVHDIQATILNQLGLDHEKLTYRFQGRVFRLRDDMDTLLEIFWHPS